MFFGFGALIFVMLFRRELRALAIYLFLLLLILWIGAFNGVKWDADNVWFALLAPLLIFTYRRRHR